MSLGNISLTASMRNNLFSLNDIGKLRSRTQERLATGKRINSALDNPTNFFAAQAHMNRSSDLSNLKDGIRQSLKLMETTSYGIDGLLSLLSSATGIANAAISTKDNSSLQQYSDSYSQLLDQIDMLSNDAIYQGINLLNNQTRTVEFGSHSLTIAGIDASSSGLGLALPSLSETNVREEITGITYKQVDVAQIGNGNFVTVWTNPNAVVTTDDIKARIVDSSGNLIGQEILVNTVTAGYQSQPAVVSLADGGFVVGYVSGSNVFGQKFDVDGSKIGSEFKMNSTSANFQEPTLAALPNGGFVASWTNTTTWDAEFRMFNSSYTPMTPVMPINGHIGPQSVASFPDGSFVVSWGMAIGANYGLQTQLFDNSGNQLSAPITVANNYSQLLYSKLATSDNGSFLVTWADEGGTLVESSYYDSSQGSFSPVQQLGTLGGTQSFPDVARLSDGTYEVVWRKKNGPTVNDMIVVGQALDANGNKIGSNHIVSTTSNFMGFPAITALSGGGYAAFWATKTGVLGSTGNTSIDFNEALNAIDGAVSKLRTFSKQSYSTASMLTVYDKFIQDFVSLLDEGAANLTLADMNVEGASMLMLQTRENIGINALSLASQSAQSVIKLF